MSTRRKHNSTQFQIAALIGGGLLILLLAVYLLWLLAIRLGLVPDAFVIAVFAGLAALVAYALIIIAFVILNRRTLHINAFRALQLADVDQMTGTRFEELIEALLTQQGYRVRHTGQSGDLGVDLVAVRPPEKIAVQCKRQSEPVSRRAVSDAFAGMRHYGCNRAMVVTNSAFSPGARELARSTGCVLVDREMLGRWILAFQNGR